MCPVAVEKKITSSFQKASSLTCDESLWMMDIMGSVYYIHYSSILS